MMRNIAKVATFVVLGVSAAGAQQKPFTIEVGADAAFSVVSETFGTTTENTTTLSVPVQAIRLGFFSGDRLEVEPRVGLSLFHSGSATFTEYSAQLGVLYHLNSNAPGNKVYIRPFVGVRGEACTGGSGDHQVMLEGGLGVKITCAMRFATRL